MHGDLLTDVVIILVAAVIAVPLFKRIGLGPVLGYLVAGLAVGPAGLGLIGDVEDMRTIAELGVVFLLFAIGLEMKLARLATMGRYVLGLGSAQVLLTGAAITGVLLLIDVSPEAALVAGGGLALSSTAIVLQVLQERGQLTSRTGRVSFAVLILQDLAVVPLLALVPMLKGGGASVPEAIGLAVVEAVLVVVGIVLVGRYLLRPFLRRMASQAGTEVFAVSAVLLVLGASWLTAQVGLSMPLGAFLAGLMLAETEFRHQIEADIQPFRGFLLGLFFITVGMSVDLNVIFSEAPQLALAVVSLILVKTLVMASLARAFRLPWSVAARSALLLSQGGEFGFVLFGLAAQAQVMDVAISQFLIVVVSISMMITPVMAIAADRLAEKLRHHDDDVAPMEDLSETERHVIIAGFGRVGQTIAQLLTAQNIPYVALDLQADRVAEARAKGLPVYFADASQAEVLRVSGAAHARAVVVTLDQYERAERCVAVMHQVFSDVPIFARARDRRHSERLQKAGATRAMPETLEASLQLGAQVLRSMGVDSEEVGSLLEKSRRDDYAWLDKVVSGRGEDEDETVVRR